jgi:spore coat polysaccharide biosynthesis predicted glycosyltransferase SpsG
MNRGNILFRVDGSAANGMGRMARCLALANALQRRRYQMTFVSQIEGSAWPDRIRRFRHAVQRTPHSAGAVDDRAAFLREVVGRAPTVVVVDSATIDADYLAELRRYAPLVIALADAPHCTYDCDLLLNPMLTHALVSVPFARGVQVVGGDRFAMIRAEFRRARNVRATEPSGPPRVMVALGGGDNGPAALAIVKALLARKKVEKIDLVLGGEGGSKKACEALAAEHSGRLHVCGDARDMGVRMTKSHLLITGGGNTSLEAACVGIPMLLAIRDESQEINAMQLDEAGAAQYLGRQGKVAPGEIADAAVAVLEDTFERKAMSRSGRLLIDGRGADRMVTATEILLRRRNRRTPALVAAAA